MSISVVGPNSRRMTRKQIERAVRLGRTLLGAVGVVAEERHDHGNGGGVHVIHVRRPMLPEEEALTPDWFRAMVPTDSAGGCPLLFKVN